MLNTGKLAGRTAFITGASRGIGEAIAKKLAKDGANIVIAAKTAEPHPKLPGTIYSVAEELESMGGKCLPCVVDVQNEKQVEAAVEAAVKKFGGIDILVNNASAISLTGTLETPMKRYDLMHGVNTRGTYLVSQKCIPYLKQSKNAHILNISPPLNMSPHWFGPHVAYTMAKYGMSMCVLGMAEELRPYNIAVNALWPRTAIYTAAMAMLGGGDAIAPQCRKPEIMSDSAYVIMSKDSKVKSHTGNFYIDDEVLRDVGVTNLDDYAMQPGHPLLPDFFLDQDPETVVRQMAEQGANPKFRSGKEQLTAPSGWVNPEDKPDPTANAGAIVQIFASIEKSINPELIQSINGVYTFELKEGNKYFLDLKSDKGSCGEGSPPSGVADVTMKMSSDDFVAMFTGKLNATGAFMAGKLKITGNMGLAMKLEKLMQSMNKAKL